MTNLLLADFSWATAWPVMLLGVLLVGMIVFQFVSRKKYSKQEAQMREQLKVGDKIVTNAGVYGEIIEFSDTNFGKVALIKTGEGDKVSYLSINASVILGIDVKEPVVLDAEGNPILPAAEKVVAEPSSNPSTDETPKKSKKKKEE
ncbi:MAG: preprotein translocase subunit YajC [Christensenellaceae bacterium]|jgi:preprotein translocase YajC subunit|nr:preprotein translocase subunit YajC [Christensenellaceae bacterium]